ncbi:MAG: hypothetical protein ACR2G3_02705 [Solirubrobacterales bacterium]
MSVTEHALHAVGAAVRDDDTLLSEHLREPAGAPSLGALAAAGHRAAGAESDYAFVVEAIREGYLLHFGEPRVLGGLEPDLALLAGDHLYALGLECLAGLGDLEAVRELADLISLAALVHADGPGEERTAGALWLAASTAVGVGAGERHAAAKERLRAEGPGPGPATALAAAACEAAGEAGVTGALTDAADSIDFELPDPPARG